MQENAFLFSSVAILSFILPPIIFPVETSLHTNLRNNENTQYGMMVFFQPK